MINRHFSRRSMLLGAGATAIAGLVACDRASLVSLPAADSKFATIGVIKSRTIVVSEPTGAAIQAAIDELASRGGGSVELSATAPYIIKKTIFIGNPSGSPAVSNITLTGRGPDATSLVAADGARFYSSDYGEYLLLVDYASNVSIQGIGIDTINRGVRKLPRIALCVFNSNHVFVGNASFINNQGPNGYNQGLGFVDSTNITAQHCAVDRGRIGISLIRCSQFTLHRCTITNGGFVKGTPITGPYFPGSMVALDTQFSSSGQITYCELDNNLAYGGIEVQNAQDVRIAFCKVRRTLPLPFTGNDGISVNFCPNNANVTVENCEALGNSGSGISTYDSTNVTIKDCKVVDGIWPPQVSGAGIGLNGATKNVRVIGNRIFGAQRPSFGSGIQAGTAVSGIPDTDGAMLNNYIENWDNGIFLGSFGSGFVVEYNVLSSNTTCINQQPGGANKVAHNTCS